MTKQEIDDLLRYLENIFVLYPNTSIYHKKALTMYGDVNRLRHKLYPPVTLDGYTGDSSTVKRKPYWYWE